MFGESFSPDMPHSCRSVAVMRMQVADLVMYGRTLGR